MVSEYLSNILPVRLDDKEYNDLKDRLKKAKNTNETFTKKHFKLLQRKLEKYKQQQDVFIVGAKFNPKTKQISFTLKKNIYCYPTTKWSSVANTFAILPACDDRDELADVVL